MNSITKNSITKKIGETLVSGTIAIVLALGIGKVKDKNRRKQDMDDTLKRAKTKVSKND